MNVIDNIMDRLSIFKNLYDIIRIVDPVSKTTINFEENASCNIEGICFEFWKREGYCKNCVSMRAYLENDTCIKLEYIEDKVYILIASPIKVDDKFYIVEMLKDITLRSNMINSGIQVNTLENFVMEMNSKVVTDELSGVYNKKYMMERLPVDINVCIENNQPISAIALDVDMFSNVNHSHGYKVGDKILKELAQMLSEQIVNENDWIARYGGDKFILVLNKCHLQDSYRIAENFRQAVENKRFTYENGLVAITVSLSVFELKAAKADCNRLLQLIKDSMYEAKSQGRNRIIIKKL
jgi:two-component system, cell cycle response regulator